MKTNQQIPVTGFLRFAVALIVTTKASAATFTDNNWISLGGIPGADDVVTAAVVDGAGNLYIGGIFTMVGDVFAYGVAKWDGNRWSSLGSGLSLNAQVNALAVSGTNIYVGGRFTTAGGVTVNNIAKWNGSSWSALGSGIEGDVYALAVSGNDVYAGGPFIAAGGSPTTSIARWNGSSWSALGSGMGGSFAFVQTLAVLGNDVYAGGRFASAGGVAATNIARWNGSNWSALGSGTDGYVVALAVLGTEVYVGGAFTTAGGVSATNIAKWDGSSWSAFGSGIGGDDYASVSALAVSGNALYVGGYFTTAGGIVASNMAKWDGNSWSAVGSGTGGGGIYGPYVAALIVSGSTLYAGGGFTTAGGNPAKCIAKWNGTSWSLPVSEPVGLGMELYAKVNALAVAGNELYAGGDFTTAGTNVADHVAKWNGRSWSALGTGMNGVVRALAVFGQRRVRGRGVPDGGWCFGLWDRQIGRQRLVGPGFGDECPGRSHRYIGQQFVCGRFV